MKVDEFSVLAVKTLSPLFNYAFRLTRSREEAEDLVQDTFVRAFSNRETFDEPAAVRPIMFTILHNLFVNQWWAKKRRPALVSFDDWKDGDALPALCTGEGSEPSLLRNSLSEEVESALSELNEVQRATIWLREVEGFSYVEIAEVTSVPVGTVRSRLARARRDLAEQLLKYARARGLTPRDVVDRGEEQ